jgi:hypothetical protein
MTDAYFDAVRAEVFRLGGRMYLVSRERVEMCAAIDTPVEECARLEVWMQDARAQLAREMAKIEIVGPR